MLATRLLGDFALPTLVLLPGFCESSELWHSFQTRLSAHYCTLAIDLPGFGRSADNPHYHSVEAMAEEVRHTLDAAGVTACVVVGHSLGGYVALALAERYPALLRGLALFHSAAHADPPDRRATREKTAAFIETKGVDPFLATLVPSMFFAERREELAEKIEWLYQLTRHTAAPVAAAVTRAMRDRPNRLTTLAEAAFPVMFIAGKDDALLPLSALQDQFLLPRRATIHLLADTGHAGMLEREAETLAMVSDFAARCQPLPVG